VTPLSVEGIASASYELFKVIVGSDDLTDEYWEAARHAIRGAFRESGNDQALTPYVGEQKGILKFIDYHLGLKAAGEDHMSCLDLALDSTLEQPDNRVSPLKIECLRDLPSFVRGVRSAMDPSNATWIRERVVQFISLVHGQWFNSPVPVMEPEEIAEFCEHLAVLMVDDGPHAPFTSSSECFALQNGGITSSLSSGVYSPTKRFPDGEGFRW